MRKHSISTFVVLLITFLVCSCASIRTDGIMNVNNRPVGMIYFKTANADMIIEELEKSFGKSEQGQYPYEYWWYKVNRPELAISVRPCQ